MQIAQRYPDDAEAAKQAMTNMVTLPRKMLPIRLQIMKRLLLTLPGMAPTPAAATVSAFVDAPTPPSIAPPPPPAPTLPRSAVPAPPKKADDEQGTLEDDLATRRRRRGLRPGQLDPSPSIINRRTKELADRRAYLRNFWYAAAASEQVTADAPLGVEMLGMKLSLFRDAQGVVRCVSDVCPHRGAPLSKGWVEKHDGHNCVVCPYHGWAIDGDGYLRDVPAAEHDGEWPTAAPVVDVYPVAEKGGFVWLFFGRYWLLSSHCHHCRHVKRINHSDKMPVEERPPIPYVPELDDPAWKPVYGEIEFDCPHWGTVTGIHACAPHVVLAQVCLKTRPTLPTSTTCTTTRLATRTSPRSATCT